MLDSCECKHPPLVKDVIQVIWLLFQQHRNDTPFDNFVKTFKQIRQQIIQAYTYTLYYR